jgi:hypothetical protein
MENWYDIAVPHEDIRKGRFDEAVFAANLAEVAEEDAPEDYGDPYTFFRKTYLTDGLTTLLEEVHEKLTDGAGAGIVELQTPFGGGKTHSLVTIYHYLKHGEVVRDFLPDGLDLVDDATLAVIVGTHLNPVEGETSDGLTRRTLWGEVAFQLGGQEAYERFRENDETQVAPGKKKLGKLLETYQPFVLLFDEILEYVVKARGVEVKDTTLAAETLSFFNELTEAVAGTQRGLLIGTLPSSRLEDFGELEQRNLAQVEKIFDRVNAVSVPVDVEGEEVHSIIRRRLFEPVGDEDKVRNICDAYYRKYQEHKDELPGKVRETGYREKLERAYPFHPDVINLLYEKWGTFPSFQRTRGALRFLAHVVEDLWDREVNIDLILPGDINLGRTPVRRELLRHIGQEYEGIIAADIAGGDEKARQLDKENRTWKHLGERVASSIFLHSFTGGETEAGATMEEIKLAVLRPDTTAPLITEVVQKEYDQLWYLNKRGGRYHFSNVPNLNRMLLDRKDAVPEARVREEVKRHVQGELGRKLRWVLWPTESDDLPDSRDIKLAVLDPARFGSVADVEQEVGGWMERRGNGLRVYRNTLLFAVPDRDRFARLTDDVRALLALDEIRGRFKEDESPAGRERLREVERRVKDLQEDIPYRVWEMYRTALIPRADGKLERVDLGQPSIAQDSLDGWYRHELTDPAHQKILDNPPSPNMLAAKFLANGKAVSLHEVLEQFYKNTDLPLPAKESLVARAVASGVSEGAYGVGAVVDGEVNPASVQFEEQVASSQVNFREDLLLIPGDEAARLKTAAEEEEGAESEPETEPVPGPEGQGGEPPGGPEPDSGSEPEHSPKEERLQQLKLRVSGLPASKLADINRGVLLPLTLNLSREDGDFEFTLGLEVRPPEGIPKDVVERVRETLRQLEATIEKEPEE